MNKEGGYAGMISPQALVDAGLYPDERSVIQEAMRALWQEHPLLRVKWAIYQYQTQEISLAKAAAIGNVCFDRMKELLLQRGIQTRLGADSVEEALLELETIEDFEPEGIEK